MADGNFSIRVERAPANNMYAWVIMEHSSTIESIEVASSLKTYEKPSQAVSAAERVLGVLLPNGSD